MLTFSVDLLSNASATGAGVTWGGGKAQFSVAGTLGGATVALESLGPDGTSWLATGASVTAAGVAVVDLPQGQVRASVTSGTPSGLYARLARIPQ